MRTTAVILEKPGALDLRSAALRSAAPGDVVVDVAWSAVSSGTERLLWTGRMPDFPGMGYPLVPGYETVGHVASDSPEAGLSPGTLVFVPGANAFEDVRSLFGGAARRLVVPAARVTPVPASLGQRATLLALAATAVHIAPSGAPMPQLIVGHGVLGRLLARLAVLAGGPPPIVWERDARRRSGADGYAVVDPADDDRRDYARICDVSGSVEVLDTLITRLAPGGEIVLAGFYDRPVSFAFAPAFMREARLRVAAQWQPADLAAAVELVADGRLSLGGLLTHHASAEHAGKAYRQAFGDVDCLKMCLDWSSIS
jgi:3-hydroxyethyl bacteriochlorophyllide a dehydrogenase